MQPFIKMIFFLLILTVFSSINSSYATQKKFRISAFVLKAPKGSGIFWDKFNFFLEKAVNDLGMEILVYDFPLHQEKMTKTAIELIEIQKPDCILIIAADDFGLQLLEKSEELKIPCIVVNTGFRKELNVGLPREKYKYWIGEILPNDEEAGYILAKKLFQEAKLKRKGMVNMVAFSTHHGVMSLWEREKGLYRALNEYPEINFLQLFNAHNQVSVAKDKFKLLKTVRYPETFVVWCTMDRLAIGIIDACKDMGIRPGKDILLGGVNWSTEGLNAVESGELVATVGGHYLDGAWAAVLAYDYLNGKDFASENTRFRTRMLLISKDNLYKYKDKLSRNIWNKVNFLNFTKTHTNSIKEYNFSVKKLLEQLQ